LRGLIGFAPDRGEVPRSPTQPPRNPAEDLGEVVGVPADRVELGMGLAIQLILGNTLQHLARVSHLPVELREYRFGVVHEVHLRMGRMSKAVSRTPRISRRAGCVDIEPRNAVMPARSTASVRSAMSPPNRL